MPGKTARIKDVAAAAGLSVGTVSNVLNNRASVAPENRERVLEAINELGFVRSDIARQLRGGRSATVALVVLSSYNAFYNALADACAEEVEKFGATLVLGSSAQDTEREARYIEVFEEQEVRGMILVPVAGIPERAAAFHKRGTPLVVFDGNADVARYCSVSLDSEASGFLAVSHLINIGRTRLLIVGGPTAQISDRIAGALRAASEHQGVDVDVLETADMSIEIGAAAADEIAAMPSGLRPTGIFAANDLTAVGLVNRLTTVHGLRVPEDIAVVGHDDIEIARLLTIPLTTIRQPLREMARAAANLVDQEASSKSHHNHVRMVFAPELVVRASA